MSTTNPLDRDGFVKVYRRVFAEIYGRLRRRRAADMMTTFVLLVIAAEHRTGFIAGSLRTIAKSLGIPHRTFADHVVVLAEAGEVEVTKAVNQHQADAGITVVRYGEIVSGHQTAVRDTDQHAVRDTDQQVGVSRTADHHLPAETHPEEVEELTHHRIEAIREALMQAFGMSPGEVTRVPKGWLTRAAKDIVAVGGVPCEVRFRYEAFKERIGRKPAKPVDIANEWARLDCERAARARALRAGLMADGWDDDDVDGAVVQMITDGQVWRDDGIVSRQAEGGQL